MNGFRTRLSARRDLAEDQVRAPSVVVEVLSRSTEDHDRGVRWVA